jgi:hypothetical protein
MPVVKFTLQKGQTAALKTKLGNAVNLALENAGVSKADRFRDSWNLVLALLIKK